MGSRRGGGGGACHRDDMLKDKYDEMSDERRLTDRRILFFLTYLSGRRASFRANGLRTVDDGQTNSVSFDTICLAVECRSEPAAAGRLTMDRRILFFFTYLSGRRLSFPASGLRMDGRWTDDSVLFDLSVWPSTIVLGVFWKRREG